MTEAGSRVECSPRMSRESERKVWSKTKLPLAPLAARTNAVISAS
jgi:hypothetical protein